VVCHPHPLYGGDMDNPVVVAIARQLVADGLATLRFNFGGVGGSQGVPGAGAAEVRDVETALAALASRLSAPLPLVLAGYSFGAWAALRVAAARGDVACVVAVAPPLGVMEFDFLGSVNAPIAMVVGDRDPYCPADAVASVAARHPRIVIRRVTGADHFFAGREGDVAALARPLLTPPSSS